MLSAEPRTNLRQENSPSRRDTRARFEQWAHNPLCQANVKSAVYGVSMAEVAKAEGLAPGPGQSPFAIARGVSFEAALFLNEGERLQSALKEKWPALFAGAGCEFVDLRVRLKRGKLSGLDRAIEATADFLRRIASRAEPKTSWLAAGAAISVPGNAMMPEAVLVVDALHASSSPGGAVLTVGEIKSYPDRDGFTDASELALARAQAGVYVHGLRAAIEALGLAQKVQVSDRGFLVLSKPGSNQASVRAPEA